MTTAGDDAVLRIVHTSDWHLGCPFKQFRPLERARLQRARRDALEHVFGEARHHGAHAVLCAGDLFDDHQPREAVWQDLLRVLKASGVDCPVVLLPGNHDPMLDSSIWQHRRFREALPDFVHVVDRDDFELELPYGARLFACPTRSRMSSDDPILKLPGRAPGDESIRIAMVHGQTFQVGDQAANHPVDPFSAGERGFDYVALGDTHGFRELTPMEAFSVVYSGTPEQMAFGEKDAGHVAVVSIARRTRRARVKMKRVGTLTWKQATIRSMEDLGRVVETDDLHDHVLRLEVEGHFDPERYRELTQRLDALEGDEETTGRAAAARVERRFDMDDSRLEDLLVEAPDALQEAARLLRARRAAGEVEPRVADRAMASLLRLAREVTR